MRAKKIYAGRGRPRKFDVENACHIGERLFWERGYDQVGIATLTEAIGIKPPSFYAAFGSKAEFFNRVLNQYSATMLPISEVVVEGRSVDDVISDLILLAARQYAGETNARGCLAIETVRSSMDVEAVYSARQVIEAKYKRLREFVALTHPARAAAVTDFVEVTLYGLSACARDGWEPARIENAARIAAAAAISMIRP